MSRIAIILTIYNRKDKTLCALNSIGKATHDHSIQFYICDDGSTDGSSDAIMQKYPNSTIVYGDGNYFWSKGMHAAMQRAQKDDPDFYLMINDDVVFFDNALNIMLESHNMARKKCGIVGSTMSAKTNSISYGGRKSQGHQLVVPNGKIQLCDWANWNCFLIDRHVVEEIGLIDDYYEHGLGDFDYSLMMSKRKLPIYVATDYIGICENNSTKNTYHDSSLSPKKRIKSLFSKRNMPIKSRWHYYWKHFRLRGIKPFLWPYIKCLFCIIMRKDY